MQFKYFNKIFVFLCYELLGMEFNFNKYSCLIIDFFGILYDYGSVMYYDFRVFSRNGWLIIVVKKFGVIMEQIFCNI